ncbi:MAG: hypothetical protein HZC41_06395 [Chloroflexi bacterium]|nr:hypothetical protein [Chloroflexota bacterium]
MARLAWAVLSWLGRSPANRRPWVILTALGGLAVLLRNRGLLQLDGQPGRSYLYRRAAADGGSAGDDLTVIEGIGAKTAAALHAAGIDSYAKLARASEPELRTALAAAGMRFAPSLSTWPQQAEYAMRGDWERLQSYKEVLTAGRES